MSIYTVLRTLWSISQQRDILPGEEVEIEDGAIAAQLLERGCIEPVEYDWHEVKSTDADVC